MTENVATPRISSGENLLATLKLPEISLATNEQILDHLRHSYKISAVAADAEQEVLILRLCEQLEITVSEDELQAAGDTFRQDHKLLTASETLSWLAQQRLQVEEWSESIRVKLLTQKLKERLFGSTIDTQYLVDPYIFKRVALSQILVLDLTEALRIVQALQQDKAAFCSLALQYSKGKQSKENGGFVGIRFVSELLPELGQAIAEVKDGDAIGPIETKLGYHILKVEKWFSHEFREVKEQVLEFLLQTWLKSQTHSDSQSLATVKNN